MPFNGGGTFVRLYQWTVDAANSINISSSRTDAEMNGFAAGLTNCITRDGQSPPSANIPWGGVRLTNLGAATAGTDALNRDTADARYILTTATAVSLAGSLAVTTNATVGGNLTVTGTISTNAGVFNATDGTAPGLNLIKTGASAGTASIINTGNIQVIAGAAGQSAIIRADTIVLGNQTLGTTFATLTSSGFTCAVPQTVPSVIANGSVGVSTGGSVPVGFDHTRVGQVGYHMYNGGSVSEWLIYQPAHATSDDFRIATVVAGVVTDRLAINPAGLVSAPAGISLATRSVGDNTSYAATTAFVQGEKAPAYQSATSSASVTPTFTTDLVDITALATGVTINNPTGTAVNGWGIVIRITDNGSPQTISYGAQYIGVGVTKPTTTVAGKTLILGMIYNAFRTRWEIVSVAQE